MVSLDYIRKNTTPDLYTKILYDYLKKIEIKNLYKNVIDEISELIEEKIEYEYGIDNNISFYNIFKELLLDSRPKKNYMIIKNNKLTFITDYKWDNDINYWYSDNIIYTMLPNKIKIIYIY